VLRLVAALLLTPAGLLDPLALPKDTTDNELQRHALVLQEHLSHPDNARALARLLRCPAAGPGGGGGGGPFGGGGGDGWAAGLRRLLKLTAAGLFDGGRLVRERGGQLASGAYGSTAKATVGAGGRARGRTGRGASLGAGLAWGRDRKREGCFILGGRCAPVSRARATGGSRGVQPWLG
jgi:hypothetical protein